jgi:enolase
VGDEGGYGPRLESNRQAVEFVVRAIGKAGLRPGEDVSLALDVASSHFYRDGHYVLKAEQGRRLTSAEMVERLAEWAGEFPIDCIEDGLAEEDWQGWQLLTEKLGAKVRLVGDEPVRHRMRGACRRESTSSAANAVLIKVNQIGTLTENIRHRSSPRRSTAMPRSFPARSGETEDDFLADLAVGVGGDYIKIGSIARSERLAKYNRLLRIWEELTS